MTRRRRFADRPHDHLAKAAARAAALAGGVPHESELAAETETELAESPKARKARAQHRDRGGRFT